MDQVRSRLADKFSGIRDDDEFMRHLVKIVDLTDYPKMLIPFDRNKMIDFYLGEAKRIGGRLFK